MMFSKLLRRFPSGFFFAVFQVLALIRLPEISDAIQLKTSSSKLVGNGGEVGGSAGALQNFISRPVHWPEIVLSSNRVELKKASNKQTSSNIFSFFRSPSAAATATNDVDGDYSFETLEVGDTVIEYFALNQFQVEWTCTKNEPGRLVVVSPDGVPGIAKDCVMDFQFDRAAAAAVDDAAMVRLTMEYKPESPLAVLATPALVVDNWLALNVLLPAAVDTRPLESYRKLMGILYGIAGVGHLVDLLVGGSQLFTTIIGIPSFENLDLVGQLYSLFWCAVGPLAYYLSVNTDSTTDASDESAIGLLNKADTGIVLYGIVEVLGAVFIGGLPGASPDVVTNAVGVQAIVLAAWIYSFRKQQRYQKEPTPLV